MLATGQLSDKAEIEVVRVAAVAEQVPYCGYNRSRGQADDSLCWHACSSLEGIHSKSWEELGTYAENSWGQCQNLFFLY